MSDTSQEKKVNDVKNTDDNIENPNTTMDVSKFVNLDNLDDIKKNLEGQPKRAIYLTDGEGNSILHTNSAKGNLDIIKYLLEHDPPADVNKKNNDGDTPSHLAAIAGNLRALKLLFKNGADGDITNKRGLTPLQSVIESENQGNSSQDIEEVINFLEKDKKGITTMKDYYDTIPEQKVEEKNEAKIEAKYDDSNIDNDDDLEDTPYNITWKENKAKIKALYSVPGITQNLVNYGNNLILFYEKKISAVKELIERKSSDGKKNFVGDTTIQDEQRKNIAQMLWDDPSTKKMSEEEKMDLISGYYTKIGSQAKEIMEKDYNDRNRTIKYLLLIREYESNIESIQKAIDIKGAIQLESSTEPDVEGFFDFSHLSMNGGSGKKIMRGGANQPLYDLYRLLIEEYKSAINSPINDTELKTYLIQYFDKLQFLIADPVNFDELKFKEACNLLLNRINFLKQTQNGGQKGGGKKGFLGKIMGSNDSDSDDDDEPLFFGSHESENIERKDREEEERQRPAAKGVSNQVDDPTDNDNEPTIPETTTSTNPAQKPKAKPKAKPKPPKNVKLTPDSPEAIEKFINSNELLELENMLNDGEITNIDIKDSTGDNAFGKAQSSNNLEKLWYLINKGVDINQKIRDSDTLLQRVVKAPSDNSPVISQLLRLGASKDGIDEATITNPVNKKAFNETSINDKDTAAIKNELKTHMSDLIKQKETEKDEADSKAESAKQIAHAKNRAVKLQKNGPSIGKIDDTGFNHNRLSSGMYPNYFKVRKFIDSNDLLELTTMLSNEYIKGEVDKWAGDTAWGQAQADGNLEKIYWLISKGAKINQDIRKESTLLEKAVYDPLNDWSTLISDLIKLGAKKDDIDDSKILNAANKKAFDETNYNEADKDVIKNEINNKIEKLIQDEKAASPSAVFDQSDPKHPLYGQWKALQDATKKRDDDFIKWGDEMKKLLDSSTKIADEITNIKNGTLAGPQKYEDQKAAIEKVTKAQLDLIEAQTKSCIDAYTKQTDDLNSDLLKQKQLATQILNDIKSEENKELLIDNENILIGKENQSYIDKQNENSAFIDDLLDKLLDKPLDTSDKNLKFETPHEMFVRKYITTNYVKKNLYEFMNQCRLLDSVPEWRAKISTLMVGYLTSYVVDPNDKSKHISVIPSYDYFNLVLQGTPGVGKSYSSAIIGKALKWCGFLTVGKMKEIKKPDIVGSYTGQTAPKVYNELTQGLGNIVFIDEAYSIAGAKDETKGTFNEFGQEALDAITDYTSEHIGLLAFIVAGYEYEMQNQFLNVNIGLPRRFPTVLTLRRYDMKSFWKILEMPIIKFCPKYQVDHQHHACFELLNIMFNFQWTPNPVLQISKNWSQWWESYTLKNLNMNLKVNMLSNGEAIKTIPFVKLSNFDEKIKNIKNTNITATSIDVLPLIELIGGDINMETATFIKAYFIYKFCNIRNGDFFRSQADNLTKFGQTILSDKIINPEGLFLPDQDKNKNGNTKWIEYIYFNLYFTKNPNKPVENINFSFQTPTDKAATSEEPRVGGSKIKQYTKKNIKAKKYTRRNTGNKNKKTIHKHVNKKHKKTIRQRGGDITDSINNLFNYYINYKIDKGTMNLASSQIIRYIRDNTININDLSWLNKKIEEKFEQLRGPLYVNLKPEDKKFYKGRLQTILSVIKTVTNPPIDSANTPSEPVKTDTTTPPQVESTNVVSEPVKTDTTTPPQVESTNVISEPVKIKTTPLPTIIKPIFLPNEIADYFSTVLNYYFEPSISKDEFVKALVGLKKKIPTFTIDELKNLFIFSTIRLRQLKNPDLNKNPSKDLGFIITRLSNFRTFIFNTLETRDKRFLNADIHQQLLDEADMLEQNPELINSDMYQAIKTWPEFEKKLELKENLNVEDIPLQQEYMSMNAQAKKSIELQKQADMKQKQEEEMKKQQIEQEVAETKSKMKNVMSEILDSPLKNVNKDLVFDIERIDFSAFRDTQDITETIVRNKIIDNEINKKEAANEKLKTIFVTFMKKYDEYLSVFSNDMEMTPKQVKDLPTFIYTYLLLACYNTAFVESKKPLTKFNNDSWWFFTADDFKVISNYLDIETIINSFNRIIGVEPEVTPENKDIKEIENVAQDVAKGVTQAEVKTDIKNIEEDKPSDESK